MNDVSDEPNWANAVSGLWRNYILREKPGNELKAGLHLRSIPSDADPRSHLAKSNDYFCPQTRSSAYSRRGAARRTGVGRWCMYLDIEAS